MVGYEHVDMQSDLTYVEQPMEVLDQKGTSALKQGHQARQNCGVKS